MTNRRTREHPFFPAAFAVALALVPIALAGQASPAPPPDPPATHDHHAGHHGPTAPPAESPGPVVHRLVDQGLAIEIAIAPAEAQGPLTEERPVRVRLSIADTLSNTPMSRLNPGAWLDRLAPGEAAAGDCKTKIETFLGGSALSRPEVDLNAYYVLALNQDATISVVDPLFGYGNSKLLAMVFLETPGEDWALTADGDRLFVSQPDSDLVAAAETETWKVVRQIPVGPRPRRLGLQPDGQYLWVAWDGAGTDAVSGVTAINARDLSRVADIPTGKGGHDLAFSDDSRFVFVTNEGDGTVSVVDVARLAKLRDVRLGARPVSLDWSTQAKAVYVTAGEAIAVIDPARAEPVARIQAAGAGLGAIRFAPGGRLAFVVQPAKNLVHIVDAASNRLIQTADVEAEPDAVAFSDELAYVRHRGSAIVLMIPLKTVGEPGRPVPLVDFTGGEHPPGRTPRPTPAAGIVAAPGGHPSVLVANPEDKAIYYYKEGMAAPMGHFRNYDRNPRAVLVVDRSLRETRPGTYETVASLGAAGNYQLALFLESPRIVRCFPLQVAEDPVLAAARRLPLDVQIHAERTEVAVGEAVTVRLQVADPETRAPRPGLDVRVLTFLSPGTWQQRHWATDLGKGAYEIRFEPPETGVYFVFVEIASAGMPFQKSPFLVLTAQAGESGGPS